MRNNSAHKIHLDNYLAEWMKFAKWIPRKERNSFIKSNIASKIIKELQEGELIWVLNKKDQFCLEKVVVRSGDISIRSYLREGKIVDGVTKFDIHCIVTDPDYLKNPARDFLRTKNIMTLACLLKKMMKAKSDEHSRKYNK